MKTTQDPESTDASRTSSGSVALNQHRDHQQTYDKMRVYTEGGISTSELRAIEVHLAHSPLDDWVG